MAAACERLRLPHGTWVAGTHCREAQVWAITGADQEFVAEAAAGLSLPERTTALLARCVTVPPTAPQTRPDDVAQLTVGDRQALLLALRRATLGDALSCLLHCPEAACGQPMDVALHVGALLQPPYPAPQADYERTLANGLRVRFRLPTGADEHAAARVTPWSAEAAAEVMLRRCVQSVHNGDAPVADWPAERLAELPAHMAALDPQGELRLDAVCPECGAPFTATLDAADYLFRELAARAGELYREVHRLALHYHWSERDILALPLTKRQRYLDMVLDAFLPAAPP